MKKFKIISVAFSSILVVLISIYLIFFECNLMNDIFTSISLVLSINDEAFANKLFEINYKSYYGNELNKYVNKTLGN